MNKDYFVNFCPVYTFSNPSVPAIYAVRIALRDGRENLRLYMWKDGEVITVFDGTLSKLDSCPPKIEDFGFIVSYQEKMELRNAIFKKFPDIPVIPEIRGLGWQMDASEKYKRTFAGSSVIRPDGSEGIGDFKAGLPDKKGEFKVSVLNEYMRSEGNPVRQIILLYGLAAPLTGLFGECFMLSLCGKSSTGKTTAAKLSLSQTCAPDYPRLYKTFNSTGNAAEQSLDGINGTSVLIDDTSLASDSFNWADFIYRLSTGTGKDRLEKNTELRQGAKFSTTIFFTAETPILDRVDPSKEGIVGRLVEIPVSGQDLFDDARQCRKILRYATENYGITLPELVKVILKKEGSAVLDMVENETAYLEDTYNTQETVVQRHYKELAVLRVTAKLANEYLGYQFDVDEITDFLITNISAALEKARIFQLPYIVREFILPRLYELPYETKVYHGESYRLLRNKDLMKTVKEALAYAPGKYTCKNVKEVLLKDGLIYCNNGDYSTPINRNGKTERFILLNKEGL